MHPKCLLTLILSTLITITNFNAQWIPVGLDLLPDTQRIASIDILNEDVVWGVSFYDKTPAPVPDTLIPFVFRTTNGGDDWEVNPIEELQGRICQDIFVVDDTTAWITSNGLVSDSLRGLFKTIDGGKTWAEKLDDAAGGGMIHFFDDTIGIAMHDRFLVYTFDAGETWDQIMPTSNLPFDGMENTFYSAANNAFAISGDTIWFGTTHGRIFRSLNRGFQWEIFETPFEDDDVIISTAFRNATDGIIFSYAKLDSQQVFSVMDSTKIALTYDGGETWELADTLFGFKVNCVTGIPNSQTQFLGITNGLSTLTNDSTQTWQNFSFRPYNAVEFFSAQLGWVGNSQTSEDFPAIMYKWDGVVSSNHEIQRNEISLRVFPNPFTDFFHLEMNHLDFKKNKPDNLQLEIYDVLGKKIKTQKITEAHSEIHFSNASNGIYFYILKTQKAILNSGRLVLKR